VTERSDEQLYCAFRDQRDEGALGELVQRHWARLYRLALGLVRDPATAEDVAQEACIEIVRAARAAKTLEPFGNWIVSVVLNRARNARRGIKRRTKHEEAARRREEAGSMSGSNLDDHVAKLPDELATVIILHFGLGLTHAETAKAVGCPTGTVASRLRSGLERLRSVPALGAFAALDVSLRDAWAPARSADVPAAPRAARLVAGAASAPARAGAALVAKTVAIAGLVLSVAAVVLMTRESAPAPEHAEPPKRSATVRVGDEGPAPLPPPAPAPSPASEPVKTGAAVDVGEPAEKAPPYPWAELSAQERAKIAENRRLFDARKFDLDFEHMPLAEAVARLNALGRVAGLPPITVAPEVAKKAEEVGLAVTLELREVTARNALEVVAATEKDLAVEIDAAEARIVFKHERTLDSLARETQIASLPAKRHAPPPAPHAAEDAQAARRQADAKPVTFDWQDKSLIDVVNDLQDQTGENVLLSKEIDGFEVKVTCRVSNARLDHALDEIARVTGLAWGRRSEGFFIGTKAESPPAPAPNGERFSLELRGVTVRDVVRELERRNVRVVVSPEAWRSNATLSLVVKDASRDELGRALPLEAIDPREPFVFRGALASAREALACPKPSFTGVAAQVEELQVKLVEAVEARRAARAAKAADLLEKERTVHELSRAILDLVERARALEGAKARRDALPSLQDARTEAARARLADKNTLYVAEAKLEELEVDVARADEEVRLLEAARRGERLPESR
jgi:RNA polymerase sigma-70 factor (ECF subfamily)